MLGPTSILAVLTVTKRVRSRRWWNNAPLSWRRVADDLALKLLEVGGETGIRTQRKRIAMEGEASRYADEDLPDWFILMINGVVGLNTCVGLVLIRGLIPRVLVGSPWYVFVIDLVKLPVRTAKSQKPMAGMIVEGARSRIGPGRVDNL